ncbi:hypothetical protein SBA5_470025 [Candidatus Sulfotelmatomonas gaucii]|uniref:Uncharacterized protein n=1 Tax=Candidatus Sulfuritelmatomonas gaucii TaxID=2043161 RepID=A0A2N9LNZ4_9BACT|nr:hypothetical protein SBA5_470025 [Candidatus Sulfotelmatomonas gaucii]
MQEKNSTEKQGAREQGSEGI